MNQNFETKLKNYFNSSSKCISNLDTHITEVITIANKIHQCSMNNGNILIAGNGGSSADAQHFAGELTCTFKSKHRKPYPAIFLGQNPTAITAWANDFGYDTFFSRQVEAFGKKNDILILISTGGGEKNGFSSNLVHAAEKANELGLFVFSLIGKTGGELKNLSNNYIKIESHVTSNIQESHITIIHAICELLEDM